MARAAANLSLDEKSALIWAIGLLLGFLRGLPVAQKTAERALQHRAKPVHDATLPLVQSTRPIVLLLSHQGLAIPEESVGVTVS